MSILLKPICVNNNGDVKNVNIEELTYTTRFYFYNFKENKLVKKIPDNANPWEYAIFDSVNGIPGNVKEVYEKDAHTYINIESIIKIVNDIAEEIINTVEDDADDDSDIKIEIAEDWRSMGISDKEGMVMDFCYCLIRGNYDNTSDYPDISAAISTYFFEVPKFPELEV